MPQKKKNTLSEPRSAFIDTSIIVDVDRGKQGVIELCKQLTSSNSAYISTVSV